MDRPEDKYVKLPALIHAARIGFTYMSIHGKEPGIDYDPDTNIFYGLFREATGRINSKALSEEEAKALVGQIRFALTADDLGRAFFNYLQTGLEGKKLIDFENPSNNTFTVVTELPYTSGEDSFRPDIVFLINGMPLAFMEVKRQNNTDGIRAERERMFSRFSNPMYRRFVNITQIMAFSNNQEYDDTDRHKLQGSFYASSAYGDVALSHFREQDEVGMLALVGPRNPDIEKHILADNNLPSYYGMPEFEASVEPTTPANRIITSLFSPQRLLFLLQYGIAYVERTDDAGIKHTEKHIMRYPQLFATFATRKKLDEGMRKGTIWHTQGSGKTALSYFLSRYLQDYFQAKGQITRFFFIVDRLDLADQAAREFRNRSCNVQTVNTRSEFQQALKAPNERGAEAAQLTITVVNIQKFDDDAQAEPLDYNLNIQRVFFIDEAHREYKNGGRFLTQLVSSDRDAIRIALTGTPLIGQMGGNNTREVFGDYIHTYFYDQSIKDGYTLKLLREDIRSEFRIAMQERIRELQEVDKLVDINQVLEHKKFVEPLTDYIVDDYVRSQIELGDESIGAMVVAHTAPQARAIYAHLCQYDQDISSALILHDEGSKEERRALREDFVNGGINILVVFNMLLTGFDAHRLKKLYMCRTVGAHNLLQALTRVNRPYGDMSYGYVVDFADITEEYDKANRAYLRELTEEYGDATQEWSSLFEDQEQVGRDLARIKDVLFGYAVDNVVEFIKQIDATDSKQQLYDLRNALKRYRELRNLAQMHGFEQLYELFDLAKAQKLLGEVEARIRRINQKEALALQDMSTRAINQILEQMEFSFRRVGEEELTIADQFQDRLRSVYVAFGNNLDPSDPTYVNLLALLKEKLAAHNIEELTASEMTTLIHEFEAIKKQMDELNRTDALLRAQYKGDAKFLRVHKKAMRTPPPLTNSPTQLHSMLMVVKGSADEAALNNQALLSNQDYFKAELERTVLSSCKQAGLACTIEQVKQVAASIATEYFDEYQHAS